jgi:hypothetical protein
MAIQYVVLTAEPYGGVFGPIKVFKTKDAAETWAVINHPWGVLWRIVEVYPFPAGQTYALVLDIPFSGTSTGLCTFNHAVAALKYGAQAYMTHTPRAVLIAPASEADVLDALEILL